MRPLACFLAPLAVGSPSSNGSVSKRKRPAATTVRLSCLTRPTAIGLFAAAIAGDIYRRLYQRNYFSVSATSLSATMVPGSVSIP